MPIADDISLSNKEPKVMYAILNGDEIYNMSDSKTETIKLWQDNPEDGDILVEIRSISTLKLVPHRQTLTWSQLHVH